MVRKLRKTFKHIVQDLRRYELVGGQPPRTTGRPIRGYQSETPLGFRSRASHSYFVR